MKAAVLYKVEDIKVEEVDVPAVSPDEVLVRVKACGICGTDLHFYEGTWAVEMPIIPGHEFAGVVEAVGSEVVDFKAGDRVAVDPNITCDRCFYCRKSTKSYMCENLVAIGVDLPGAFAELVKAPSKVVYKIADEMELGEGAFTEPLGCCLRGWDNIGAAGGETVVIIGAGPVGLLHVQLARLYGAAKVIIVDELTNRLELAESLGADVSINFRGVDVVAKVNDLTDGRGADIVIEAVGKPEAVRQAFDVAGRGAKVNIFGVCPQGTEVGIMPFEHMYWKELTITAAFRDPFTCQRAIELLGSKRVKVTPMITHRMKLEQIEESFGLMKDKTKGAIKILVLPQLK